MRGILFKAKRKDNGEWVEGYYLNIAKINHFICTGKIKLDGAINGIIAPEMYTIDPDTICRYTGLNDKNGQKIWENDILHRAYHAEEDCIVQWHDGSYRFKTIHGSYRQDPMTFLSLCFAEKMVCNLKVIGNIFDNVDLLEVEREK